MRFFKALLGVGFVVGLSLEAKAAVPCDGAGLDNNVWWAGLEHSSFDSAYRAPFGALKTDQGSVRLKLRSCAGDLSGVRLVVWEARSGVRKFYDMYPEAARSEESLGRVQSWSFDLPLPRTPDILYYFFEARDGADQDYYIDDDIRSFPGGTGRVSEDWNDSTSFQISVYDKDFKVPKWAEGAIVYSIFPDRFRNGDGSNDPSSGSGWVYGQRIRKMGWNERLCDPVWECPDQKYNLFYGGDLKGIESKLADLKQLGVSVLYLNPIFESPTNHRYDTTNFLRIDPKLGTIEDFRSLSQKAKALGIRLMLDGVFNHVSADSPYFDLFGRWDQKLQLSSPDGQGVNDGSGACESEFSPYRSWFYIPHQGSAAVFRDRQTIVHCPNPALAGSQAPFKTYEAWFGFFNVPKLNTGLKAVRDFFVTGGDSAVVPFWLREGAAGWRLDVGGDIDRGWTQEPGNSYWEDFRRVAHKARPDTWIVGEEWGNGSPWLLGSEWDSVMNYRLRAALMNWMFDRCEGAGCRGNSFVDNDSNDASSSGPIFPTSETQLLTQILGVQESYPEPSWKSAFNLLGSHDTNRILFLLKKISGEDPLLARRKLRFLTAFLMTYPGAPSIYYGDEVGVDASGAWHQGIWQDDPYNRAAFPWADQGLRPDLALLKDFRRLGQLRAQSLALQKGDFRSALVHDEKRLFAFTRSIGSELYLIVMNRKNSSQSVEMPLPVGAPRSATFVEVYPASGTEFRAEGVDIRLGNFEALDLKILRLEAP